MNSIGNVHIDFFDAFLSPNIRVWSYVRRNNQSNYFDKNTDWLSRFDWILFKDFFLIFIEYLLRSRQ